MDNITIIIPIHKLDDNTERLLSLALNSVNENKKTYKNGNLSVLYVIGNDVDKEKLNSLTDDFKIIVNNGNTDFCSQINYAVDFVETEYFSILEYDDEYNKKWFNMANDYYFTNEDVSVFLPINVQYDENKRNWQYGNEMVLATSFSNEIGFIDFECLENFSMFNLTGGIFNTNDFKTIGKFKPSLSIAFNYEFLLRLTNKKLKAMVVPKEGYKHMVGREGSLSVLLEQELTDNDIKQFFDMAKKEYEYTDDRDRKIKKNVKSEILK